jgi:hypothetical protein
MWIVLRVTLIVQQSKIAQLVSVQIAETEMAAIAKSARNCMPPESGSVGVTKRF